MQEQNIYKNLFYLFLVAFIGVSSLFFLDQHRERYVKEYKRNVVTYDTVNMQKNKSIKVSNTISQSNQTNQNNNQPNSFSEASFRVKAQSVAECRNLSNETYEQSICITDLAFGFRDKSICEEIITVNGEKDFFEIDACLQEYAKKTIADEFSLNADYIPSDESFDEILDCIEFSEDTIEELACITGVAIRTNNKNICLEVSDEVGNFDATLTRECLQNFEYQQTLVD